MIFRVPIAMVGILPYTVDTITQALDNGNSVCVAFLDLRKVFDSLDHCLLLQRLFDLGVSGVELKWFTDYLHHRMQLSVSNVVLTFLIQSDHEVLVFHKVVPLDPYCFLFNYVNNMS